MKLTDNQVDAIETNLRKVESALEKIGRSFCDVEGGAKSWNHVNNAIMSVRDAIHNAFEMRVGYSNSPHIPSKQEITTWLSELRASNKNYADVTIDNPGIGIGSTSWVSVKLEAYTTKDRNLMVKALRKLALYFGHTRYPEIDVKRVKEKKYDDYTFKGYYDITLRFDSLHEPGKKENYADYDDDLEDDDLED